MEAISAFLCFGRTFCIILTLVCFLIKFKFALFTFLVYVLIKYTAVIFFYLTFYKFI
ncbi:hypothetical protein C2G38_2102434 [Gigaspora rosea]|uniref:Uncharacterized protein n=1 Tax=Gigaspora rosea TaxID=44941 RepID=A0A397UNQ0_9GLOM|nr:hypothetical protein C2G38_2102434 [Gigaspora rosea]